MDDDAVHPKGIMLMSETNRGGSIRNVALSGHKQFENFFYEFYEEERQETLELTQEFLQRHGPLCLDYFSTYLTTPGAGVMYLTAKNYLCQVQCCF